MSAEDAVTSPRRIQLRRTKGWRKPEGAVVVSRPSKWGNPWRVGDEVSPHQPHPDVSIGPLGPVLPITAAVAVHLFRAYVEHWHLAAIIRRDLAGRDLACWCPLDQPCHADVLLEIANGVQR